MPVPSAIIREAVGMSDGAGTKLLTLAVSTLATYRLTKLVRDDKIMEDFREWVWKKHPPESTKTGYLLSCPWCLSIYFGAAVSLSRMIAPRTSEAVLEALAFSALTGMIVEREDSF
jgi:hypothetical protein